MPDVARLMVPDGTGTRPQVIGRSPFTIGRLPENDLVLGETDVSRKHAEIVKDGDRYVLRDLGSTYGTYVNEQKISGDHRLAHGDSIQFGSQRHPPLEFQVISEEITRGIPLQRPTMVALEGDTKSRAIATRRSMNMVGQVIRAMAEGHGLEEVLALVIDQAIALSGAERGLVLLAGDPGADGEVRLDVTTARDRKGNTLDPRTLKHSRSIPRRAYEARRVQFENEMPEGQHSMVDLNIKSVLCAPLPAVQLTSGESQPPIGLLYVDSSGFGKLDDPELHASFEQLSAEAAIAIANARLFKDSEIKKQIERELALAARIQRDLLPPGHLVRGSVELAATTEPCRAIGGDFFEYARMAGDRMAFVLGDVSGKGAGAALLAAVILGVLGSYAGRNASPAEVVTHLNNTLLNRDLGGKFATLTIGTLSADGRLEIANAGHNPTYVVRRDGRIDAFDKGGLMVGCFPEMEYDQELLSLAPGDLVVLYSDGVTEAENAEQEFYGEERLAEVLKSCANLSAEEVLERMLKSVHEFVGSYPQADDVTALVVRYRGTEAGAEPPTRAA
jgi:serine phosphatase RsbU (regulator of sigma subunit)